MNKQQLANKIWASMVTAPKVCFISYSKEQNYMCMNLFDLVLKQAEPCA